MRKILTAFAMVLLISTTISSQTIQGIRITSDIPVEIFLDGVQVSHPAQSIMICNLKRGNFLIEAFAKTRDGRSVRSESVYRKRISYSGRNITDIHIETSMGHNNIIRPNSHFTKNPLHKEEFELYLRSLRAESFEKNRLDLIEISAKNSGFFVQQAVEIAKLFSFDNNKLEALQLIYPSLIDKENSFLLFDVFSFTTNKQKFIDFIKEFEKNTPYQQRPY